MLPEVPLESQDTNLLSGFGLLRGSGKQGFCSRHLRHRHLGAPFPFLYQPRSESRVATPPDSSPRIASPRPRLTLATISKSA